MIIGALAEQFSLSLIYWGRDMETVTQKQKDAFIVFLDTLPFDVFLTNPIWDEGGLYDLPILIRD